MAERRPFPPSPRRRALARQAGLTAASPLLVGAVACVVLIGVAATTVRASVERAATWLAAACGSGGGARGDALQPGDLVRAVLELALPLVGAAAIAAVLAHVAQTRALWLPRRRIAGAPAMPRSAARAVLELTAPVVVGGVAFGWLWLGAPALARLLHVPLAGGHVVAAAVVTFAAAWVAIAAADALVRRMELAQALAMTAAEKREDDRLAAADPRWRAQRLALARESVAERVGRATVVIAGDSIAVAIEWHATRHPTPACIASGRGPRALQLLALARRSSVPIHRDPTLAGALADTTGPIARTHWEPLARILAGV